MLKKKRRISLETLNLTNPQRGAIAQLLSGQKNKYKKLLHEAHERCRIISEPAMSCELWFDENGEPEYIGPSCHALTGYERQQFFDRSVTVEQLLDASSRPGFERDRQRVLEREELPLREYALRRSDGSLRTVAAAWTTVLTHRGRITGYRLGMIDITAQRATERHAATLEQLLQRVVVSDAAVLHCDAAGRILAANAAAQRLLGRDDGAVGCAASDWLAAGAIPVPPAGAEAAEADVELLAPPKRRVKARATVIPLDPQIDPPASLLVLLDPR